MGNGRGHFSVFAFLAFFDHERVPPRKQLYRSKSSHSARPHASVVRQGPLRSAREDDAATERARVRTLADPTPSARSPDRRFSVLISPKPVRDERGQSCCGRAVMQSSDAYAAAALEPVPSTSAIPFTAPSPALNPPTSKSISAATTGRAAKSRLAASTNGADGSPPLGKSTQARPRRPPTKLFRCSGYGECNMTFSRSEHLARHVRYAQVAAALLALERRALTRSIEP